MSRAPRSVASHARRKKVFKAAKGFYGRRKNTITSANAAVDRSLQPANKALELLDGVRNGQPIGALLGYRTERMLHERLLSRPVAVAEVEESLPHMGGDDPGAGHGPQMVRRVGHALVDLGGDLRSVAIGYGNDDAPAAGAMWQSRPGRQRGFRSLRSAARDGSRSRPGRPPG